MGALLGSLAAPELIHRFPLGSLSIIMLWAETLAFPFYALAGWLAFAALAATFSKTVRAA
jgi:hypothetical protein